MDHTSEAAHEVSELKVAVRQLRDEVDGLRSVVKDAVAALNNMGGEISALRTRSSEIAWDLVNVLQRKEES